MRPYGETNKQVRWLNNYGCRCCHPKPPSKKRARQWAKRAIAAALALVLIGCAKPAPDVPPSVGACEGSDIVLDFYSCPEGARPDYVAECKRIAGLGYLWTDDQSGPLCVVKAKSLDEVRACNVECAR